MSVSRETPPPAAAEAVFGDRLPQARKYHALLAGPGVERGLLGPREVGRLWDRHLLNCAVLADGIESGARVCDVGSGAGLPGMVIGLLRDDLSVVLLEPLLRRWTFLTEAISALDLGDRVTAVRARAEEHRARYSVVTARALAPLDRLAQWCFPLCEPGGIVLAVKGERAGEELAGAERALADLGATAWEIRRYGTGVIEPETTAVRITVGAKS